MIFMNRAHEITNFAYFDVLDPFWVIENDIPFFVFVDNVNDLSTTESD